MTKDTVALAHTIEKHGIETFVDFLADLQVWGTPDQVHDRLVDYVGRTDAGGLITMFSYGGMPHDMAKANMRLFAEKVLPRLKARDCGVEIGGGALHVAAE